MGSSVTREVIKDSAGNVLWTIHYSYAGDSTPVSMNVNGTEYYYLKNAHGDITHIVDEDGNEVASYEYDAWGNHLEVDGGEIAQLNPYRYRGYRYDSESGLYYLQSRYYNPEWGRFVNADAIGVVTVTAMDLTDKNLYAYCDNNPVIRADDEGEFWHVLVGAGIGAAVGFIGSAISQKITTGKVDWKAAVVDAGAGALSGALAASGVGLLGSIAGNAAISMAGNATRQVIKGDDFDVVDMLIDGVAGGIAGGIGGRGMGKAVNLKTLNTRLTKRVLSDSAKAGVKYYVSQTGKSYLNHLVKPILRSGASLIAYSVGKGMLDR